MKVFFDRPGTEEIPDLAIALVPGVNEVSDAHGEILLARGQVSKIDRSAKAEEPYRDRTTLPSPPRSKGHEE